MANESNIDRSTAGTRGEGKRRSRTTPEQKLATSLPLYEIEQPDPAQLSEGEMGLGSITLGAIAIAVILGVVFYGLNATPPAPQAAAPAQTASPAANPAPHQ
jgi:hypothetical protein